MILVYDVNQRRVAKYLKVVRKYLTWVQESVFEGEIEEPALRKLRKEIHRLIVPQEDSVVIYKFRTKHYYERETIGLPRTSSEDRIV